jgi:hypothetical protein
MSLCTSFFLSLFPGLHIGREGDARLQGTDILGEQVFVPYKILNIWPLPYIDLLIMCHCGTLSHLCLSLRFFFFFRQTFSNLDE